MKFTNLKDIERYLEHQVADIIEKQVLHIVKDVVHDKVEEVVYDAYDPKEYVRREDNGGLSDVDNTEIVDFSVKNGEIGVRIENTTKGSLDDYEIADLIEFGHGYNGKLFFNPFATYAQPRPFMAETKKYLQENDTVKKEIELGLLSKGISVK